MNQPSLKLQGMKFPPAARIEELTSDNKHFLGILGQIFYERDDGSAVPYEDLAQYELGWVQARLDDLQHPGLVPFGIYTNINEAMVGALTLRQRSKSCGEIDMFAIDHPYRGSGLGSIALRLALDTFKIEPNIQQVVVSPYGPDVDRFYRANGFSECQTNYAGVPEMTLDIK